MGKDFPAFALYLNVVSTADNVVVTEFIDNRDEIAAVSDNRAVRNFNAIHEGYLIEVFLSIVKLVFSHFFDLLDFFEFDGIL